MNKNKCIPASEIGVIFDMDGVLIDSGDAHFRSWQLLAAELGTSVRREQFTATFGRHNSDIIPLIFGETHSQTLDELADRKENIYRDLVREQPPLIKGAAALVRETYEAGLRVAIGSSAPRQNIDLVVSALGIRMTVNAIVSAEDVTRGKPHPQVFTLAADRLGLPPSSCVVIEDAPAGVQAARAAGTKVIAVLTTHDDSSFKHPGHPHAPNEVVTALSDLSASRLRRIVEG